MKRKKETEATEATKPTTHKTSSLKVDEEKRPSNIKVWLLATRPHTLTASIAPVILGASLVSFWDVHYSEKRGVSTTTSMNPASLSIAFAIFAGFVQIGTNLHNDYADFVKGADNEKRVGKARATQKGWLTPTQTATAATLSLFCATIIGFYLTHLSERIVTYDLYMRFVSITSVFNAFCYTGGPYPLGYLGLGNVSLAYSGLGDLFAFLYFGIVATVTPIYLHCRIHLGDTRPFLELVGEKGGLVYTGVLLSLPVGFFATAIIVVNNLRDRETDAEVGKRTMAVRIGERLTRLEYTLLVIGAYLMLIPIGADDLLGGGGVKRRQECLFLPLLSLPMAWRELKSVGLGGKDGAELNEHVGGTARVQLMYCILLAIGIRLNCQDDGTQVSD